MKYYSIHFKRKGKTKGFIAIRPAESEVEVYNQAQRASFCTTWFPDRETIKEVSEKKYKKFIDGKALKVSTNTRPGTRSA